MSETRYRLCACGCDEWHVITDFGVKCPHNPIRLVGPATRVIPAGAPSCDECLQIGDHEQTGHARAGIAAARDMFLAGLTAALASLDRTQAVLERRRERLAAAEVHPTVANMIAEGGPVWPELS
jgi:hypothetical protein